MAAWVITLAIGQKDRGQKNKGQKQHPLFFCPLSFCPMETKVFNGRLAIHEKAEIAPFFALFILRSSPLH
jgi:hypothetical protein